MIQRLLYKNFKFFYRINQFLRYRFTEYGLMMIVVMITAAVFGVDTRSTYAFQLFAISSMLLLVSFVISLFQRGKFNVQRILPDTAIVGQEVQYICRIQNLTKHAKKGMLIIDELKVEFPNFLNFKQSKDPLDNKRYRFDRVLGYPRLINLLKNRRGGNVPSTGFEHISGNGTIDVTLTLTPLRRGHIHFDKIRVAGTEPLGLVHSPKSYPLKNKLLILPKLYNVSALNLTGHRLYQTDGTNASSFTGDAQEFVSLREYRPGDPLKAIHWRSYAKLGKPVVKEFQDEYRVRYGLLLDTYINQNTNETLFEESVSIAASYMTHENDQDALMDLMFIGNQAYRYTAGRGYRSTRSMLEILACVKSSHKNNSPALIELLNNNISECCGLLCILLAWDEARQNLIKAIQKTGIPTLALVLTDDPRFTIENTFTNIDIHVIREEMIQADLNQLEIKEHLAA